MNRLAPVSVFLACLATHVASAGVLEPISVASTGGTANQHSDTSTPVNLALRTVSADGRYVVFQSDGTNLVPGQIAPVPLRGTGLYLRDRVLGTTTLVSHSASSPLKNGDGNSQLASISADGRWVAYASSSTDLVAGIVDNNDDYDFFLFDRLDGSNTLISHDAIDPMTTANLGNSSTLIARISQDGRFVLYSSRATNLVAGQIDSNLSIDVFCYDRTTGDSMLVSRALASPSATGDHGGGGVAINADGRWILFVSSSTNLVAGQGPTPSQNVFLFDRTSGTSTLVSHRAAEPLVPGNQASASFLSSLSRDGRFVAYESLATDLVSGAAVAPGVENLYLYDRQTGTSSVLTVGSVPLAPANATSFQPIVSDDGAWVVFESRATNLVAGQASLAGRYNVFLRDVAAGTTRLVSHSVSGPASGASGNSVNPVMSSDGRRVAFNSAAQDLIPSMTKSNVGDDVFLFDRDSSKTWLLSHALGADDVTGNDLSFLPIISADGNTVVFGSFSSDLASADANHTEDVFAYSHVALGRSASFFPLAPCRVLDTRLAAAALGGPALAGSSERDFPISGTCGIPADAVAISANATVTVPQSGGSVNAFPAGLVPPQTGIVSFRAGQTRANNAIVALGGTPSGTVTVRNDSTAAVQFILDVNGFFR